MLVGGNLPPAGGEFMFGRGSNGTNRFRMEGTVNSYRRTSEKYELGLFLVFFFKVFNVNFHCRELILIASLNV